MKTLRTFKLEYCEIFKFIYIFVPTKGGTFWDCVHECKTDEQAIKWLKDNNFITNN